MSNDICVVDYGAGNIFNLMKALVDIDETPKLVKTRADLKNSKIVFLPGVGAFQSAMRNLQKNGLLEAIVEHHDKGKPIVGICLGMQLLFESSEEQGFSEGMGFFKGQCVGFRKRISKTSSVPRVGWGKLLINKQTKLTSGIDDGDMVYFNHSFFVEAATDTVIALSKYVNVDCPAIVENENLIGYQFHPEKSGIVGKKLLRNLIRHIQ